MGWAAWADAPLRQPWGQGDGVLVCEPSALPKSGCESVGVARQWCGRLGKVDHCHVAINLGYVSAHGPTLVALRLSRPKAWPQEKARQPKAGVLKAPRGSRPRHQGAWDRREKKGPVRPHAWMAGTRRWGVRLGFGVGLWAWAHGLCWRCPRTR
jgi:hypothetical protein